MKTIYLVPLAVIALSACEEVVVDDVAEIAPASSIGDQRFVRNLPEAVANLAASGQDLSRVALVEDDNCYWYAHDGPVETTLLPLRTNDGRPICVRQAAAEETS